MGEYVKKHSQKDFQIALEFGLDRIDVEPPNEELENIESYKNGSLLLEPDLGLIFKNNLKIKRFFTQIFNQYPVTNAMD